MEKAVDTNEVMTVEDDRKVGKEDKHQGLYESERFEAIVEAVLFTMGQSVELRQLAVAIDQDENTARNTVACLKARYERENRGMQIIDLESSYQMCTKAEYYENLIRVAATPKKQMLTEVVLETLSIIAYKQPVTKMEIEKIRGVKSDHAVNRLVEYNLVYEVGRLDAPGRPALFATTEEFLRRFGVGSAEDLPTINPEVREEIKSEVEEELQFTMADLGLHTPEAAMTAEEGVTGEGEVTGGEEVTSEEDVTVGEHITAEEEVTSEEDWKEGGDSFEQQGN